MKKLWWLALVLVLLGCESTPEVIENPEDKVASPSAPPPLFAPLFREGHTMRFSVVASSGFYDESDPEADASGVVRSEERSEERCTVHQVEVIGEAHLARLDCEQGGDDALNHVYVATPQGLWLAYPGDIAEGMLGKITSMPPYLAAHPTPDETREENDEGHGRTRSVVDSKDGSWCVQETFWAGDEGWESMCFHPKLGITEVERGWAGGGEQNVVYSQIPD